MRQRKSKPGNSHKRPAVGLDQRLEKKLISYALVAGAAGVSALACVPRADAKVVFTNTWVPITPTTAITKIDLNSDGIVDFVISLKVSNCSTSGRCIAETMKVLPQGSGNAAWGNQGYASALGSGVRLGSKGKFQAGNELMERSVHAIGRSGSSFYASKGRWGQTTNRYLGVEFIIQRKVHYGWVRLDVVPTQSGMYGAISGYAYETVPGKSILTGQKSGAPNQANEGLHGSAAIDVPSATQGGLGILALGALGRQSWRGRDVSSK